MKQICSFPSKIYGLCRRPFSRRDAVPLLADMGLVFLLFVLLFYPSGNIWFRFVFGVLSALLFGRLFLRLRLTRRQYQPVMMEIYADAEHFSIVIPALDIAGVSRGQHSIAQISSLSAFEYSPSLHCIRIEAHYDTVLLSLPERYPVGKCEVKAYHCYLSAQDEGKVLASLEKVFRQSAKNMDQQEGG